MSGSRKVRLYLEQRLEEDDWSVIGEMPLLCPVSCVGSRCGDHHCPGICHYHSNTPVKRSCPDHHSEHEEDNEDSLDEEDDVAGAGVTDRLVDDSTPSPGVNHPSNDNQLKYFIETLPRN